MSSNFTSDDTEKLDELLLDHGHCASQRLLEAVFGYCDRKGFNAASEILLEFILRLPTRHQAEFLVLLNNMETISEIAEKCGISHQALSSSCTTFKNAILKLKPQLKRKILAQDP